MVIGNLFNDYFSQQCTAIGDSSIPTNITFENEERLPTFWIFSDDIVKIIGSLEPNKAYVHDEIAIFMIKRCVSSISKQLEILFRNCSENECFPKEWKKSIIVPVHKKMINSRSKIIGQYHYYLFVLKFLKRWYLIHFLNT